MASIAVKATRALKSCVILDVLTGYTGRLIAEEAIRRGRSRFWPAATRKRSASSLIGSA